MLLPFLHKVAAGEDLSASEAEDAMLAILSGSASTPQISALLMGLRMKGETSDELLGFARAMREKTIRIDPCVHPEPLLDTCGTGGGAGSTFNISTVAAFVVAGAGARVAKHGNRSFSTQCGSADILEELGVPVSQAPERVAQAIREIGIGFLFAPLFHPAMKYAQPARAELKMRTVFNLLGPLLNPAQPSAMLAGVPRPDLCEPLARVLQSLGVRRAMVVAGKIGNRKSEIGNFLDELSTLGENTIAEFFQERGFTVSTTAPEAFPLRPATIADLLGGDKNQNAEIVRRILAGDERGPKRDAVLLNAGAALFVAGKTKSLAEGWTLAAGTIDGGKAEAKLSDLAS